MRYRLFALFGLFLVAAPAAFAQDANSVAVTAESAEPKPSLQQRLLPETTAALLAPAQAEVSRAEQPAQPALAQRRGSGTGMMIAGGALFIAGLLVGGDAGTVLAVVGAAIGAYGLYIYFQ
jgi:hypothetical protein